MQMRGNVPFRSGGQCSNYNVSIPISATPSQLYAGYSNGLQATAQDSGLSKYAQLLAVIEEMGRDIRPTYAMGRGDRLKRLIIQAKVRFSSTLLNQQHVSPQQYLLVESIYNNWNDSEVATNVIM